MRKILFSLAINMLLLGSVMSVSAQMLTPVSQDIGVVDVKVISAESSKLRELQEQLNTKGKELSEQLEVDKANLSSEEFQVRQQVAYDEFTKVKQQMEKQFDQIIQEALREVAKEKSLKLIVYKNSVAFGGIDITNDVLNKLQ